MITSERDWLVREQPQTVPLDRMVTSNAREALHAHIAAERHSRPRHSRRSRILAAVVPMAAAAAVLAAVLIIGARPSAVHRQQGGAAPTASVPTPAHGRAHAHAGAGAQQSVL